MLSETRNRTRLQEQQRLVGATEHTTFRTIDSIPFLAQRTNTSKTNKVALKVLIQSERSKRR